MGGGALTSRVRIWDLPTRLFHWVLALCVSGSVISAKIGGNAMIWHQRLGCTVLALLAFRLLWGLVGGRWSRFASFLYGPGALWRYLRGRPRSGELFEVGHSPLGALAVLAMLAWLLMQVGSGLVADDEIMLTGPLARFVSTATSLAWTAYHKRYGQWGLYLLVGLHLTAIAYYRLRSNRRDLIAPMFSGDKRLPPAVPATRDTLATRLTALALLLASAAGVVLLIGPGRL
ncbi:MAG: cytochrome b/b6 domain-containing protein [Burkholderiaceae bacterium]